MRNTEIQSILFGAPIVEKLPKLEPYREEIQDYFSNKIKPDEKISLTDRLLFDLEEICRVNSEDKFSISTIQKELERTSLSDRKTNFLTDASIEEIVWSLPPENLLQLLDKISHKPLENRTLLALSRFTESEEWKETYSAKLRNLTPADISTLSPAHEYISSELSDKITSFNKKPWGLSHSKETGLIIISQPTSKPSTPHFLQLAVFLHYWFEVVYFGDYLAKSKKLDAGATLSKVIQNKSKTLTFLTDKNAHDETLYWRHAVNFLMKTFNLPDTNRSFSVENNVIRSNNLIDKIWSINAINNRSNHSYHLQQEIWFDLLFTILNMNHTAFEKLVTDSLLLNNEEFLTEVLHSNVVSI